MRVNNRRIELVGSRLAFGRNERVANHDETIDMRVERAEAIRELLGQHRHNRSRKVDGCASHLRIAIEGRPRPHVVTHIGNRDKQTPARIRLFAVNRVVEVARVLAVDRYEWQVR